MINYTSKNVELVGYHDLDGEAGFKMGIKQYGDEWYLFVGNYWHPGWFILNVTDPKNPRTVKVMPGPENTTTNQVLVPGNGNLLVNTYEPKYAMWGGTEGAHAEEGLVIWDITDPENPRQLCHWKTGSKGVHRCYYNGGKYLHIASTMNGYEGFLYQILDVSDPTNPTEAGRFFLAEQFVNGGGKPIVDSFIGLHDIYVVEDRAYLSYGREGVVVVDISDVSSPKMIGHSTLGSLFCSILGIHTAMPVAKREDKIAYFTSESIEEECTEPLCLSGILDISDETKPRAISIFPLPVPTPDAPYKSFSKRGGRFGPHNVHQWRENPYLSDDPYHAYLTYFNAGLRIYDTTDPYQPVEVGFFLPEDPKVRRGIKPEKYVPQFEEVIVDSRGYAYVSDKTYGIFIVKYTGQ